MAFFIDQTGSSITTDKTPSRIISLVPSQTELLSDLGLHKEVAGITKFCVHPIEWHRTKTKVGGTKQVKMELIYQLHPDLIIANKEENGKEQIEELQKHFPVWVSNVNNLEDAYEMIEQVGLMTNKQDSANNIVTGIRKNFAQPETHNSKLLTCCYLIWQNPYMTVGGDSFIHSMLEAAGYENIFAAEKRYPEVTIEQLKIKNPELLFLSSEPFPFRQKDMERLKSLLPHTQIVLVDGEMFSWYGSRLLYATEYFIRLRYQIN